MQDILYKNEIIKRRFFDYLRNSKGYSEKTIVCFENAIWLWEDFTKKADFGGFNQTKAMGFKDWLVNKKKRNFQENVSLSFCYDNLRHLRKFFEWLSVQSGYKSKINPIAIEYLNLPQNDVRIAIQSQKKRYPTLDEIKKVIESINTKSEIDKRDKALISLMFLTGMRISAIASLPMESFNSENFVIDQNPKLGVQTKRAKRIATTIIPFSYKEPLNYFLEWFNYLKNQKDFKPTDPIFPATKKENGKDKHTLGYYNTGKVEPVFWKSQSSVRSIFGKRFKRAGVDYYHPHSFRHLLVKEISKIPLTEEEKKAISQNLGHEDVGTTFGSYGYGRINDDRQIEIIRNINFDGKRTDVKYSLTYDDIKKIAKELKEDTQLGR